MNGEAVIDLQNILDSSKYAICSFDTKGNLVFSNTRAKKIFPTLEDTSTHPFQFSHSLLDQSHTKTPYSQIIDLDSAEKKCKGHLSDIIKDGTKIGMTYFFSLEEIESEKEASPKKRTFSSIRKLILVSLLEKSKTINQIGKDIEVNWKTVENHLTYLTGKKFIQEVFSSSYVRIFEITQEGKQFLEQEVPTKLPSQPEQKEEVVAQPATVEVPR